MEAAAPRRVRHWRERFDPDAEFVWLRRTKLTGERWVNPGDRVDKALCPPGRLRTLWNTGRIALADPMI